MARASSLLPADAAGAAQKLAEALARLGQCTVSYDLVEAFCVAAVRPPPVMEVIGLLARRRCSVFFFSTALGAYRALVAEGKAPHFAMLEAALKGETWVPPASPVPAASPPPVPAPVVAPPPQPAPIPLDRDGHLDLDARPVDRLEAMRRFVAARRNGSGS